MANLTVNNFEDFDDSVSYSNNLRQERTVSEIKDSVQVTQDLTSNKDISEINQSINFADELRKLKTPAQVSEGTTKGQRSKRKPYPSVAAMIADDSIEVGEVVETVSYYDGWAAENGSPIGGNSYLKVSGQSPNEDGGSVIYTADGNHLKGLFLGQNVKAGQFGAHTQQGDNSSYINALFSYAVSENKQAVLDENQEFTCGSQLYALNNLKVIAYNSTIIKNFTTESTDAFVRSITMAANPDVGTQNLDWRGGTIKAVSLYIGETRTNKLFLVHGRGNKVKDITFDTYSGWACTMGGVDTLVENLHFENPLDYQALGDENNGIDGFHWVYGGKNSVVRGLTGVAGDDFCAILNPLAGAFADSDIEGLTLYDVIGKSLYARLYITGIFNAAFTANCKNVHAYNVQGVGKSENNGVVTILNQSDNGSVVDDIKIVGAVIDAGGAKYGLNVRSGSLSPKLTNVSVTNCHVFGDCVNTVCTLGKVDDLTIKCSVDAGLATESALFIAGSESENNDIDIIIENPNTTPTIIAPSTNLNNSDLKITVKNLPSNGTAIDAKYAQDCNIVAKASKASDATGTVGVDESGFSNRNNWLGSDFSKLDTPASNLRANSDWRGVRGVITELSGLESVAIGDSEVTINFAETLPWTPQAKDITFTPRNDHNKEQSPAIASINESGFTLKLSGAVVTANWTFGWQLQRIPVN